MDTMGHSMTGKRKNRFWSDDEKQSICQQASVSGVSVAQVARRYAMNANLIFKWLKDPRFAPASVEVEAVFLPVEIEQGPIRAMGDGGGGRQISSIWRPN